MSLKAPRFYLIQCGLIFNDVRRNAFQCIYGGNGLTIKHKNQFENNIKITENSDLKLSPYGNIDHWKLSLLVLLFLFLSLLLF